MKFLKQHWFKIFILLPIIPTGILIYSLDSFIGVDESQYLLITSVLILSCLLFLILGIYIELSKVNFKNKRVQSIHNTGNLIGKLILSVLIIGFIYTTYRLATISVRFNKVVDNIVVAPPEEDESGRSYSLVTMSDFDVNNQGSYGHIGILAIADEAKNLATEEFLYEQNFILNPIPTVFDSPFDMMRALYDDEIDAIIVGSSYVQTFDSHEHFESIEDETIVLSQFNIELEHTKKVEIDSGEPFSILLLGLNSKDELSEGQINTFMLLTVNLEELSLTAVSIPRDSYVPIPCFNYVSDKLSHTNWGDSANCAVSAIEHMFDMEIPHYVKLNFTGFMEIIDVLGGIAVDVPFSFSEQDSNRRFGEHLIHLEAGHRRLNAEEALALTRHRGMMGDDFVRVEHQQLVFQAMLREMLNGARGIDDILSLLEVVGHHVETNLSYHDITVIAQYLLGLLQNRKSSDLMEDIHFINTVILGDTIQTDVRQHGNLWVSFPWPGRVAEARRLMMINLGLEEPTLKFAFEFDGFTKSRHQWGLTNETYGSSGMLPVDDSPY